MPSFPARLRGPLEPLADEARQPVGVADGVEPDPLSRISAALRVEVLGEELHEGAHLLVGAPPVLGAEGVEGEGPEPELAGLPGHRPDRLRALAVPLHAGQSAGLGPAAVPIHDDGDVAREGAGPDPVLHPRNEVFLAHGRAYNTPPGPAAQAPGLTPRPGDPYTFPVPPRCVGPWEILTVIGRGGVGNRLPGPPPARRHARGGEAARSGARRRPHLGPAAGPRVRGAARPRAPQRRARLRRRRRRGLLLARHGARRGARPARLPGPARRHPDPRDRLDARLLRHPGGRGRGLRHGGLAAGAGDPRRRRRPRAPAAREPGSRRSAPSPT